MSKEDRLKALEDRTSAPAVCRALERHREDGTLPPVGTRLGALVRVLVEQLAQARAATPLAPPLGGEQ